MSEDLAAVRPRLGPAGDAAGLADLVERLGPVAAGEPVGLQADNGPGWVLGLLALLRASARPLLLSHDSPPPEVDRLLAAAGGTRVLRPAADPPLAPPTGAPARPGPRDGVLLTSSGSTGAPRLVARSARSLADEGRRYLRAGLVTAEDTVVVPLPMSHSYALGWVAGALLAGARVVPVPPTALAATLAALGAGGTVLVVTPGLARLLLRRLGTGAELPRLRLVMAGAGYVDAALDAAWADRTGVGLARNYGSTEAGAVLAGPAGLPSGVVGGPLPGVGVRLLDPDGRELPGPGVGEVEVVLEDGSARRMGDLVRRDAEGWHEVIGRRETGAVRRGARWVSTLEVAAVLSSAYGVADVAVVRGEDRAAEAPGGDGAAVAEGRHRGTADDQTLVADYVPAGAAVTPDRLAAHARANLAPYKVPTAFRARHRLARTALGKTPQPARFRLTSATAAAEAVAAYRRSEILFALAELGALPGLAAGRTVPDLAAELGLDADALAELMAAAHHLGLVTTGDPAEPADPVPLATAVRAELAVRADLGHAGLVAAIRPGGGSEDRAAPRPGGGSAAGALDPERLVALRRLAGVGRDDRVAMIGPDGPLLGGGGSVEVLPGSVDVCLIAGAVHGPGPAADLVWLAERLAPGGRLAIEDRFLDGDQGDPTASLAWLARDGRSWWRLADLHAGLGSVGLRVARVVGGGPTTSVLAVRDWP